MTGDQIGNFRIIGRLGEGGMGEVFRAMDTMLEREVALKTLRPELSAREELVERFRVEAIALAKLNHPNIAAVYSFFRENDRYHMAMQFVHGQTLEQRLIERTRLGWKEAAQVAIDVLQALEHAHAQGVIHRDLKPANLMLDPTGRTVVMDFGIARVLARARQTRAGNLVGTMEYIAPEIVRGEDPDRRADLYSLGVVLFELVTGRLPFVADTDYAMMRAHTELPPPLPTALCADLPKPFEAVILRALAKTPAERFSDAREFLSALCLASGLDEPHAGATRSLALPTPKPWWSRAIEPMAPLLGKIREQFQPPSQGGWVAWVDWGKANPGLAMAGAAGLIAIAFVVAGLLSKPKPLVPASDTPAAVLPVQAGANTGGPSIDTPARSPVSSGAASPPAGDSNPPPRAADKPAEPPRDSRDVVMPPEPKPNVVIERTPPAPETPPHPRPVQRNPEPERPSGGWYIKR